MRAQLYAAAHGCHRREGAERRHGRLELAQVHAVEVARGLDDAVVEREELAKGGLELLERALRVLDVRAQRHAAPHGQDVTRCACANGDERVLELLGACAPHATGLDPDEAAIPRECRVREGELQQRELVLDVAALVQSDAAADDREAA